ncbi:hypothetical protein A1O7_06600 [Cladophialophora yegresii CBS 114405]|uniref:Uncharacterized protein n=1 Tax=Cladophialophora yegresii CBS 114405 TaxID=1182544 RepID=W9VUC1_9EURO|nr:uncharacterized protein A1O7_06600 [Cladophialophora yegresii CBS 114405]EXJ59168.1 hypothetical protein A1O7_06600 [Cladophialophora yegresii CBS 114405]
METIKNTVNHLMSGNNQNSSEEHSSHHHLPGHHKQHDDQTAASTTTPSSHESGHGTSHGTGDENPSPAEAVPSKPTSAGNSGNNDQQAQPPTDGGDRVQSPDQGADPALVGEPNPTEKLSGTAAPGSHSALFGLTPDGKKNAEASKGSGAPQPAHSTDTAVGGGKPAEEGDTSSRAPTGNAQVSEQLQKTEASPGEKGGQRKDPVPLPAEDGTKPGAGATGLQQGGGDL